MVCCSMENCDEDAIKFVFIDFISEEGSNDKDVFGYCYKHWKDVRNYYERSSVSK